MKITKIKSGCLATLLAMACCFGTWKNSSIKDVTNAHVGVYQCKSVILGGVDYTEKYGDTELELKGDGTYVLRIPTLDKKMRTEEGKYSYDRKKGELWLSTPVGGIKKSFPLKKGVVYVTIPLGNKTLRLELEQKG